MEVKAIGKNLISKTTANVVGAPNCAYNAPQQKVSFQGGTSCASKRAWLGLRKLSNFMKDASEMTNAGIAAIGTGIIAPLIILVSPGKGDKEDKDKKFFQAIRQPLSAILALSFQVPATMFVNHKINQMAYEKKLPFFQDDTLGTLIPDPKYLEKNITRAEYKAQEKIFDGDGKNKSSLRKELEKKITEEYKEVGIDISEDELATQVKKSKKKFIEKKIVEEKHNKLLDGKVEEFLKKNVDIQDIDLVTESYQDIAIQRNKAAYDALEQQAKLSPFDRVVRALGLENEKLKSLKKSQDSFAKEKALEILKQEKGELLKDPLVRTKEYVKNMDKAAQKTFAGKLFWLSLVVNLFMVTASCYALNWAHPKLKGLIDKYKDKKVDQSANAQPQQQDKKKVEVNA